MTTRLPKGLTAPTARLVEQVLRGADGDLSAAECAERAELSRVSARRYLEHFVQAGAAVVTLRRDRAPGAPLPLGFLRPRVAAAPGHSGVALLRLDRSKATLL